MAYLVGVWAARVIAALDWPAHPLLTINAVLVWVSFTIRTLILPLVEFGEGIFATLTIVDVYLTPMRLRIRQR